MILHALVNGDQDRLSERMVKKIMYTIAAILKVKDHVGEGFKLPKVDAIINYCRISQIKHYNTKVGRKVDNVNMHEEKKTFPSSDKREKEKFSLSAFESHLLLSFESRQKSNNIPDFPTAVVSIETTAKDGSLKRNDATMNLPSDHLKLFVANPNKSKMLSALPDHTHPAN
ncbi:hypothetical protein [Absidia glauca]|uniref:Uncharacterized protein n=1 Tax=Absidia glauca TaxID=4829 RepID=A0A168PU61_ABSGL|nr:hypothetical protein [Absidia glauca]